VAIRGTKAYQDRCSGFLSGKRYTTTEDQLLAPGKQGWRLWRIGQAGWAGKLDAGRACADCNLSLIQQYISAAASRENLMSDIRK
jgi:hypothetical protein